MRTILIIEDSEDQRNLLGSLLGSRYRLFMEGTAEEGLKRALIVKPELILLDLGLPEMDGYELCNRVRSIPDLESVPIVILSGQHGVEAHSKAYRLGADNYLEKPFEKEELLAIIESKLKYANKLMRKTIGNLTVDLKNGVSLINGEKLDLTPKEFKILAILWESVDQVVTREAILKYVWDKTHVSDRVIDNHVTALRKKIKEASVRIESIYAQGYKLLSN